MGALFAMGNAVVALTPAADQRGKEGYTVTISGETGTLSASATVAVRGVILDGQNTTGKSSVGILGAIPPVRMVASGAITAGDLVQQAADGTVVTDAGSGSRVIVGLALESAVSGDSFIVATCFPQPRS